jgi:predicted lipoprotein with Yx(FWY)xxD motif
MLSERGTTKNWSRKTMTMRKRFGVTTAITAILLSGAAYAAGEAMIQSETKAPFGAYLADGSGRSVYLFTADKGSVSSCYGACAAAWPPVLASASGKVAAGPGVTAGTLGTTARRDGTHQLTYDGRPLYYFSADQAAGSTAGQDIHHFGGEWYLVSPQGREVEASAAKKSGSSW